MEDVNKAITISTNIAVAKIDATNSILETRKNLSKQIHAATTEEEVEAVIEEAEVEKVQIQVALEEAIQVQIDEGVDLIGVKPTEEMDSKNAVAFLTSQEFMTETKEGSTEDFIVNFQKVTDSFDRRAVN